MYVRWPAYSKNKTNSQRQHISHAMCIVVGPVNLQAQFGDSFSVVVVFFARQRNGVLKGMICTLIIFANIYPAATPFIFTLQILLHKCNYEKQYVYVSHLI